MGAGGQINPYTSASGAVLFSGFWFNRIIWDRNVNTVGQSVRISLMIPEIFSVLKPRYPLALTTEFVPLLVTSTNSLSTWFKRLDSVLVPESVSLLFV